MSDEYREYTKNEIARLSSPERLAERRRDLAINTKRLSSLKTKFESGGTDLKTQQEFSDSMKFYSQLADDIDDETELGKDGFRMKLEEAWAYASYHFNPAFVPVYMINICLDMAGIMKDAIALMIENLKPRPKEPKERDPNEKFFGIGKEQRGKSKSKTFEQEGHGKVHRKDVELTKRSIDSRYFDTMKKQQKQETDAAKAWGDRVANSETQRAGIFSAKHGKGGASKSGWGEASEFWADAPTNGK